MLTQTFELSEHKQKVARVYDLAAAGYDKPALKFFPLMAGKLAELAHIHGGDNVLDAGTGTGVAALAAAERVGRQGKIIGVDIGEEILEQARRKLDLLPHPSISFLYGDMEHLEFPNNTFDSVLSASTLFFLPDMLAGLKEWQRVLKPNGTVAVSGYGAAAFHPLSDLFETRIRAYGIQLAPMRPFSWQRLTEPEQYLSLFQQAGLIKVEVYSAQLGYYLKDTNAWWDVIWNSGFRGPVSQLSPAALNQFKAEHLVEVEKLKTSKGIWLDVAAIFAIGHKVQ